MKVSSESEFGRKSNATMTKYVYSMYVPYRTPILCDALIMNIQWIISIKLHHMLIPHQYVTYMNISIIITHKQIFCRSSMPLQCTRRLPVKFSFRSTMMQRLQQNSTHLLMAFGGHITFRLPSRYPVCLRQQPLHLHNPVGQLATSGRPFHCSFLFALRNKPRASVYLRNARTI